MSRHLTRFHFHLHFGKEYRYWLYELGIDDIPKTNVTDLDKAKNGLFELKDSFTYKNNLYKLGYQFNVRDLVISDNLYLNQLSLGISALHYQHHIDTYMGSGTDAEIGAYYHSDHYSLNLTLRHLFLKKYPMMIIPMKKFPFK